MFYHCYERVGHAALFQFCDLPFGAVVSGEGVRIGSIRTPTPLLAGEKRLAARKPFPAERVKQEPVNDTARRDHHH